MLLDAYLTGMVFAFLLILYHNHRVWKSQEIDLCFYVFSWFAVIWVCYSLYIRK